MDDAPSDEEDDEELQVLFYKLNRFLSIPLISWFAVADENA